MTEWTKVYDLAEDEAQVRHVQEATRSPDDSIGLRPDPALVGSDAWWRALGTEALPIVTVEGEISEVYMSGHGDMPEFALRQDDGKTSRWLRSDDPMWKVGRRARIEYVVQWFKRPIVGVKRVDTEVVVRVWLGPAEE